MYSRLNQLHAIAKENMENLISKKGMDLIKEWGIMSKKAKLVKQPKSSTITKKLEEEKANRMKTPKTPLNKTLAFPGGPILSRTFKSKDNPKVENNIKNAKDGHSEEETVINYVNFIEKLST